MVRRYLERMSLGPDAVAAAATALFTAAAVVYLVWGLSGQRVGEIVAARGGALARIETVWSARHAARVFRAAGYGLDRVRREGRVPRVFFIALPPDLAALEPVSARKDVFLMVMLPLVLKGNEEIAAARRRLLDLRARRAAGRALSAGEEAWLAALTRRYGVADGDLDELVRRVDVVPPSLALAQAILESGWGTSRFALEGNALFGQRVYEPGAPGLDPSLRAEGEVFRVRVFPALLDAVKGYLRNLNTHPAYRAFRAARFDLRRKGRPLDGHMLAGGLARYSEAGHAYVRALRALIRRNRLAAFDRARLDGDGGVRVVLSGAPAPRPLIRVL